MVSAGAGPSRWPWRRHDKGSPADSAATQNSVEGDAAETALPLRVFRANVQHPEVAKAKDKTEDAYVAIASDLYVAPIGSEDRHPKTMQDFNDRRCTRIALERLAKDASEDELKDAVSEVDDPDFPGRVIRLRHCGSNRRTLFGGRRSSDHPGYSLFLLREHKDADDFLSILRLAIIPWNLLQKSLMRIQGNPSTYAQRSAAFHALNVDGPDGEELQNTAERLFDLVTSTNTLTTGLVTVIKSAAVFAQGAETTDELARIFAVLELVGPVFQVIALVARGAGMVARASVNRVEAGRLHSRLLDSGRECFEILCRALKSGLGGDPLADMFATLAECWNLAQASERLMMSSLKDAIGKDRLIDDIEKGLTIIEGGLRDMHVTEKVLQDGEATMSRFGRVEEKMSRIDAQTRENTNEIERMQRNQFSDIGSQQDDRFEKSTVSVPSKTRLNFVVESAIPKLTALKQAVLAEDGPVVFALGHGGVGKTTACIKICHDAEVLERFGDGIHFLEFSLEANDGEVMQQLCDAIRRSGGDKLACRLEQRGGKDPMKHAVTEARGWFRGKAVLFVLDNVCHNRIENNKPRREWSQLLVDIIADVPRSKVLLTSRFPRLYCDGYVKVVFSELKVSNEADFKSAVCLLEKYAGSRPPSDAVTSRDYLVDKCKGLQLLLCVAGKMVDYNDGDWASTARYVKPDVLMEENVSDVADHPGLVAIMSAAVGILDNDEVQSGRFLGRKPRDLRHIVGESFESMYARFGLLKSTRSVPVPLLRSLFGTKDQSMATAVVRCFASVGLAEIRKENGCEFVELHDSQHAFARMLSPGKEEMACQHWRFINDYASARIQSSEWWKLCKTDLPSDVYMAENLVRHLVSAIKPCIEEMSTGTEVHFSRRAQQMLVSLLTDFNWIRSRTFGYERRAITGDFRQGLEIVGDAEDEILGTLDEEIVMEEELNVVAAKHAKKVLVGGERAGIEAVLKVLDVTHAESFSASGEACESHSSQGGKLATEMLGRLADVSFGGSSSAAIQQAEKTVDRLTTSIKDNVKGPWIQPVMGMYENGFESLDGFSRQFRASRGAVNGVAFLSCGRILVTRCAEGFLSLYDVDDGHNRLARSNFKVDIAGEIAVAPGGIAGTRDIIVCDNLSSVSVAVVSNGGQFNNQVLLKTGLYGEKDTEWLRGVDASRGANTIAAVGTRYLHIWKQDAAINNEILCTSLTFLPPVSVKGPYEAFKAVKVSKDGAFIVTASRCSLFVCVWRLSRDERSDFPELLYKVQCSHEHRQKDSADLTGIIHCLALSDDSITAYVATRTHSGSYIHRIDLPKGRVTGTLKRNKSCSLSALFVLDGDGSVETSALFAGPNIGRMEWWRLSEFSQEMENGRGLSTFTVELNSYSPLCVRRKRGVEGNGKVAVDVVWGYGDGFVRLRSIDQLCSNGTSGDAESEDVCIFRRDCNRNIDATCIAPSLWRGLVIVVGTKCGDIRCYTPETGQEVGYLPGHRDSVLALDVSRGGACLASGSEDNTVRIWKEPEIVKVLTGHDAPVTCVLFSSSGSVLVSGDRSGRVVRWSMLKMSIDYSWDHSAISWLGYGNVTRRVSSSSSAVHIACKTKNGVCVLWRAGELNRGHWECEERVVVEESPRLSTVFGLRIGEGGEEGSELWRESSKDTNVSYSEFAEDCETKEIEVMGIGGTLRAESCCHFFKCHCKAVAARFDGTVKEHSVIVHNISSGGGRSRVGVAFLCSRDVLGQGCKLGLFHISY